MKLTTKYISGAQFQGATPKHADYRWDDEIPGFGLRIWPSGKKVFVLFYRTQDYKQRWLTLGRYGVLTLHQARELARAHLVDVARGQDPKAIAEEKRADRLTVDEFCDIYLDRHVKRRKKVARHDHHMIERHIKPAWGKMALIDLRRSDVIRLHETVGKTAPVQANRLLSLISSMWNKAVLWECFPADQPSPPNPTKGVQRYREIPRDRYVTHAEMPALIAAINDCDNLVARAAVWIYLLTGMRKTEVLSLQWSYINFAEGLIRLPTTKAGRPHTLPITAPLRQVLLKIPRQFSSPYVFPSVKLEGQPYKDIKKSWIKIRKAAELSDVRVHDLRHTLASWLGQSGYPIELVGSLLNQSNISTTKRYVHFSLQPMQKALEAHADAILRAANTQGSPDQESSTGDDFLVAD